MNKIKIVVADDHSIVTEGLRIVLGSDPRFSVAGIFSRGEDLLEYLSNNPVDLVILDIDIPGGEDFSILKNIKTLYSNCKVIIFTMHSGMKYFLEAKKLGADSYVVKTESVTFLPTVIMLTMKGDFYVSNELKNIAKAPDKKILLNPIELDIVDSICKGWPINKLQKKLENQKKL